MMPDTDYDGSLVTAHSGFDGITCWVHARGGAIPNAGEDGHPLVIITMQPLVLTGNDDFSGLAMVQSRDGGETWSEPVVQANLARRVDPDADDGGEVVMCDFTPKYHEATRTLLGTGHTAQYLGDRLRLAPRPRDTAYAIYDAAADVWGPWQMMDLGDDAAYFSAGAGCTQRVDLRNGEILLPICFRSRERDIAGGPNSTAVVRCRFDGRQLGALEMGSPLTLNIDRGLYEPSLAFHRDRFFLTMRNDRAGYVAVSDDGLHFGDPICWRFDDGEDLGNYNTQQHWVSREDALYLVYTRRGLNNDHVFRHRAPLVMSRVDTDRLCVLRDSERILVPERGARLGNFGVIDISEDEHWVTVNEWMQPVGCEKYGSDNSLFVARLRW